MSEVYQKSQGSPALDRKSTIIIHDVCAPTDIIQNTSKSFTQFSINNIVNKSDNLFEPKYQINSTKRVETLLEKTNCNHLIETKCVSENYRKEHQKDVYPEFGNTNESNKISLEKLGVLDTLNHDKLNEINMEKPTSAYNPSSKDVFINIPKAKIDYHVKEKVFSKAYEYGDKRTDIKHTLTVFNQLSAVKENPRLHLLSPNNSTPVPIVLESSSILGTLLCTKEKLNSTYQSKSSTNKTYVQMNLVENSSQKTKSEKIFSKKKINCQGRKFSLNTITVLNIPNVSLCKNYVIPPSPPKRQRLSKIDFAVMRQKVRKEKYFYKRKNPQQREECETQKHKLLDKYNVFFPASSESDEEEEQYVDLWIRSGPPCKLDLDPAKLSFLKLFGLTTHYSKNTFELHQLEKRKWISPEVEKVIIPFVQPLNLPVPSKLFSSNQYQDYKKSFLQILGLKIISEGEKLEKEKNWLEIIKERLRRNCDSSLTKYLQIVNKNGILPEMNYQLHDDPQNSGNIPMAYHFKLRNTKLKDKGLCNNFLKIIPPSRILLDKQNTLFTCSFAFNTINGTWQGCGQFVESYTQFSKRRASEIANRKRQYLCYEDEIIKKHYEVKSLESKQRELKMLLFQSRKENNYLKNMINNLKKIIDGFR